MGVEGISLSSKVRLTRISSCDSADYCSQNRHLLDLNLTEVVHKNIKKKKIDLSKLGCSCSPKQFYDKEVVVEVVHDEA